MKDENLLHANKTWLYDIPNEEYHNGLFKNRIGSTNIQTFLKSPAHLKASKDEIKDQTPAQIFGSAFHSIALGFAEEVAVIPDINRRTKAGKEEWETFQSNNGGKYLVNQDDKTAIEHMVDAIKSHRLARKLIESKSAKMEVTGLFSDNGTGLPCKIRPDILDLDIAIISDLKTTIDASPESFVKSIFNFGYHISACWYQYGYQRIEGYVPAFIVIAVEKAPPYGVTTWNMRGEAIDIAETIIHRAMPKLARCVKTDKWPGYPHDLLAVEVPGWIKR